jgi:diamine N-acetyltransferase
MAQAYIYREVVKLFAIYANNELVGFSMLDVDKPKSEYWIWRLMIDKQFQNIGYGKEAIKLILDYFSVVGAKQVKLSFEKDNITAEHVYIQCGFVRNGDMHDGEVVMHIDL